MWERCKTTRRGDLSDMKPREGAHGRPATLWVAAGGFRGPAASACHTIADTHGSPCGAQRGQRGVNGCPRVRTVHVYAVLSAPAAQLRSAAHRLRPTVFLAAGDPRACRTLAKSSCSTREKLVHPLEPQWGGAPGAQGYRRNPLGAGNAVDPLACSKLPALWRWGWAKRAIFSIVAQGKKCSARPSAAVRAVRGVKSG